MEQDSNPLVSVIIITRNRPHLLKACLDHLLRQSYRPFETIVVDSSDNEETRTVTNQLPDVRYLYLPDGKNKMPSSRNLGIRHAHGNIIAFIDDDSMVREDWLRNLVQRFRSPTVGGVGGRVLESSQEEVGVSWPIGKIEGNGEMVRNFHLDPGGAIEVDHLPGGNMSFRREVFTTIGLFDTGYTGPNNFEDVDFSFRAKKHGYSLVFDPAAMVDHLCAPRDSFSRSILSPIASYYCYRNFSYFVLKNLGLNRRSVPRLLIGRLQRMPVSSPKELGLMLLYVILVNATTRILGIGVGLGYFLLRAKGRAAAEGPA